MYIYNISCRLKSGFPNLVIPNLKIMTYKIKSLIYFSCFLAASVVYYVVEKHDEFQNQLDTGTYVEADFEDTQISSEEDSNDFVVEHK